MAENVFCQVTGRDISTHMCLDLQQSHDPQECFGCGACSRMCTACRKRKPVNPEIGLCCACIGQQLTRERRFKHRRFMERCQGTTPCPIVSKDISAEMCFATQGDPGCRGCPSPFRLCEKCGQRKIYFSPYGLCLTCALGEYAPVLLRVKTNKLAAYGTTFGNPRTNSNFLEHLLEQARQLVLQSGRASSKFFREQLGVSFEKADALLEILEAENVISSDTRGHLGRVVLAPTEPNASDHQLVVDLGVCHECGAQDALLRIANRALCLRCAKQLHKTSWARVAARSPNRSVIEHELYAKAVETVIRDGKAGTNRLGTKMNVGYFVATRLIKAMEENGIIGPPPARKKEYRLVLVGEEYLDSLQTPSSLLADDPQSRRCHRCKDMSFPYVDLRGNTYCLTCSRKTFGSSWAIGLIHSSCRAQIIDILRAQAQEAIAEESIVSLKFLQQKLMIGSRLATQLMDWLLDQGLVSPKVMQCRSGRIVTEAHSESIDFSSLRRIPAPDTGYNDPYYQLAKLLVIAEQRASEALLTQKLPVGGTRARRILKSLENERVIGADNDRNGVSRRVLVTVDSLDRTLFDQPSGRIAAARQLIAIMNSRGSVASLLRKLVEDAEELDTLKRKVT